MNQLRPEDWVQPMQPWRRFGYSGSPVSLFRFTWVFIVFCPNFGTYSSQSFTSPSSYTSLALNYSTSFYQPTAFHQLLISYATPPLLRLCQGNLFLCFHKFHCLKSIPRTQPDMRKFQCQASPCSVLRFFEPSPQRVRKTMENSTTKNRWVHYVGPNPSLSVGGLLMCFAQALHVLQATQTPKTKHINRQCLLIQTWKLDEVI